MASWPAPVRAERRLLSPTTSAPARVAPGASLSLEVEVSSALTPPPGIQEARAHRAFALSLCADGIPFQAPARSCFPLAVRDVRPLDGRSLRYRVEAPVPLWVAPSRYDLTVRFPGGEAQQADAVLVARSERDLRRPSPLVEALAGRVQAGTMPAHLRLHVGAAGLDLAQASFETFPLPHATGLSRGFVALVDLQPGQQLELRAPGPGRQPALQISTRVGSVANLVELAAAPALPGERLFWWLGPDLGAQGRVVKARFALRESARIQALVIDDAGRVTRAERLVPLRPHHAFGCALAQGPGAAGAMVGWWSVAGLLAVTRSRKLGLRKRRRQRQVGFEARE